MNIDYDKETDCYFFDCIHCKEKIAVAKKDIRCTIFRHGSYKKDYSSVPPHSTKEQCEKLLELDMIYGCGKPFKFDGKKVEKCDYI
jgi:hypothetical protein